MVSVPKAPFSEQMKEIELVFIQSHYQVIQNEIVAVRYLSLRQADELRMRFLIPMGQQFTWLSVCVVYSG